MSQPSLAAAAGTVAGAGPPPGALVHRWRRTARPPRRSRVGRGTEDGPVQGKPERIAIDKPLVHRLKFILVAAALTSVALALDAVEGDSILARGDVDTAAGASTTLPFELSGPATIRPHGWLRRFRRGLGVGAHVELDLYRRGELVPTAPAHRGTDQDRSRP